MSQSRRNDGKYQPNKPSRRARNGSRMQSIREQFEIQCKHAAMVSDWHGITVDVVLVRHRNRDPSRVSVVGNAISRAAYDLWRRDGSNVRLLCTYTNGVRDAKPVTI